MAEDKRKELSAEERRKIGKQRKQAAKEAQKSVSYTHLTLPTTPYV